MALSRFFRWIPGTGSRADVEFDPDNIPSDAVAAALQGNPSYPPTDDDRIPTIHYVEKQVVDIMDFQNRVDYEIEYIQDDEAPDGVARTGSCDIDAGGGLLNCYVAAGHGFGSGTYSVTLTSGVYGTISRATTVVDANNFTVVEAYSSDESSVPYAYDTPPTEGEKCLNLNQISGDPPLLHTFTAGAWDAGVAIADGQRFVRRYDGTDTSGDSGDETADDTIRHYEGGVGADLVLRTITMVKTVYRLEEDGNYYEYYGSGNFRVFFNLAAANAWLATKSTTDLVQGINLYDQGQPDALTVSSMIEDALGYIRRDNTTGFTRASTSTINVTDDATNQDIFKAGLPCCYRTTEGTGSFSYGIIGGYVAGGVTIKGIPLPTPLGEFRVGPAANVITVTFFFPGALAVGDDIIASTLNTHFEWLQAESYVVNVRALVSIAATDADLHVAVGIGAVGNDLLDSPVYLDLAQATTVVDSGINISTNYIIQYLDKVYINVDQIGSTLPGENLTVSLVVVMP